MRTEAMRLSKLGMTIAAAAGPLNLGQGRSGVDGVMPTMAIDAARLAQARVVAW
jgi:hypothetical protein